MAFNFQLQGSLFSTKERKRERVSPVDAVLNTRGWELQLPHRKVPRRPLARGFSP